MDTGRRCDRSQWRLLTAALFSVGTMISLELARYYRAFAYMGLGITLLAMIIAVYVAAKVGLIDLIDRGYRYSSMYFLRVFLLPLLTCGLWLALRFEPVPQRP